MKQFRNILFVADGSAAQGVALARAVSLAESSQASLTVMDVLPVLSAGLGPATGGPDAIEVQAGLVGNRRRELEALLAASGQGEGIRIDVRVGRLFLEVVRAVLRDGYDLVIKPAENPDFVERLFGSNDMHLLRKCPCPVWLTGPGDKPTYTRILAAVDFDLERPAATVDQDFNLRILDLAASLAIADFAELHVVHVWDAPAELMVRSWSNNPDEAIRSYVSGELERHERALQQLRERLRDRLGAAACDHLAPQFHLRRGVADRVIPALAKSLQADLVVMGTVARTGIAGLLIGNTAEAILEQLRCAVLAVKPAGFVTPVTLPGPQEGAD